MPEVEHDRLAHQDLLQLDPPSSRLVVPQDEASVDEGPGPGHLRGLARRVATRGARPEALCRRRPRSVRGGCWVGAARAARHWPQHLRVWRMTQLPPEPGRPSAANSNRTGPPRRLHRRERAARHPRGRGRRLERGDQVCHPSPVGATVGARVALTSSRPTARTPGVTTPQGCSPFNYLRSATLRSGGALAVQVPEVSHLVVVVVVVARSRARFSSARMRFFLSSLSSEGVGSQNGLSQNGNGTCY